MQRFQQFGQHRCAIAVMKMNMGKCGKPLARFFEELGIEIGGAAERLRALSETHYLDRNS